MRSFFVMGVGSIGAVAMFAACSSPQPGAPGAGGDVVAACGTYFDSLGKREAACAAQEGIPLAPGSDFAPDSRAAFVEQCRLTLGGAGTGITPAYLTRCAAAIDKLPAGCLPNDPERGIAECLLPPGTAAVGAPCSDNEQCASGYCGKEGPDGGPAASRRFCGYCVATPGEGAPCAESGRVCGHGLACLGGTCRKEPAPVGAGGTCDPSGRRLSVSVGAGVSASRRQRRRHRRVWGPPRCRCILHGPLREAAAVPQRNVRRARGGGRRLPALRRVPPRSLLRSRVEEMPRVLRGGRRSSVRRAGREVRRHAGLRAQRHRHRDLHAAGGGGQWVHRRGSTLHRILRAASRVPAGTTTRARASEVDPDRGVAACEPPCTFRRGRERIP